MFSKFDLDGAVWTAFFVVLGIFLAFIWPARIQRRIEEGDEPEETGGMLGYFRLVGAGLLIYCCVEIAWLLVAHGVKVK